MVLLFLLALLPGVSVGQTELVPVDHKAYPFFERLSLRGIIDYNNASIPISRRDVASYLIQLDSSRARLTATERKILDDLEVEFSYDIHKAADKSFSLLSNLNWPGISNIFNDDKQKYLASYTDPQFSLFLDGIGSLSYRDFDAESFQKTHLTLGEIGPRLRGTLFDNVAFDVQVTEGQSLSGDKYSRSVASGYDPSLKASSKFVSQGFVTAFNHGYLRYESDNHAIALTFGRDNFEMGNGYIDKLFVSDNIPPFDFARLDLKYKFMRYSFFYGNLQGDSLGVPLNSKNIVGGRLDIELSSTFRFGIYQSLILSNAPISFTYLNPISVLESADLDTHSGVNNNSLIGFDFEAKPHRDLAVQLTLLIDDLDFGTLGKKDSTGDDNKFGVQAGCMYVDPFGLNDVTATLEYTLLDPFVYSHRTNMSTYTNWGISIGDALPPNSDEIALALDYNLTSRLSLDLLYQHQRSGGGFLYDSKGRIIRNFGGDINLGSLDNRFVNTFLMGDRVNRDILRLSARFEPIRQYFIDVSYSLQSINEIYLSKTFTDQFLSTTISTNF